MITIDISYDDLKNLWEMFDIMWPEYIKACVVASELDNIEFLRSLLRIHDAMDKAIRERR